MNSSFALIPNWKNGYKFFSVILGALVAVIAAASQLIPALREFMSPSAFAWVTFALALASVGSRFIQQQLKTTEEVKTELQIVAAALPVKPSTDTPQ